MQNNARFTGRNSIKQSTWLATKISFFVLMPICALGWFAVGALVIYKSFQLGVSPLEIMDSPAFARIADGLFALVELFVVGVLGCAATGATIGALNACFRKFRSRTVQH